ncbi:gamma-glutamyltransferase family protein [Tenuibacillus multivorans]|uniref:Gamma-glutamyltranspeptidase / glutathione hydrolase n=1 Tax=Tenuibacillus multivorans TaxID=237069 RepID=A0A1H0C1A4_9BACI|nr:gamma-glutamyltransferase family protein [Tenuibacillus multivorans]GEL77726.1 gamma-glutamyltransferase [Tenuibacillus multivorans]SDN51599.1 gamma-glutamyltranspeptidase / glutathione hydrolase [Tenuibacillus multivorans]
MMQFDSLYYPYASRRNAVYGRKGMVATSQPLAAEAGREMLHKGGNAIDAAISTAAALTVVEPTSNGIGSDAFAIVWVDGDIHGLNASGYAPKNLTIDQLKAKGFDEMPTFGKEPVTVPGTPAAWAKLSERFGKLPFEELFEPAIRYAEEGFPVSPTLGYHWQSAYKTFKRVFKDDIFENWFKTFAPNGQAPQIGDLWASPDHARSLREIAETKAESFYSGKLADEIASFFDKHDGYLTKEDLANYEPKWVDPIKVNYRGYDVWEIPPNGQGIIALMALNILKGYEFNEKDSVDTFHKQIEATKLAFTDGLEYITQQDKMDVSVESLLSETYADERRQLIGDEAVDPSPGEPQRGGTVYLSTADEDGNMVSFIQSNYMGFGSGVAIPGTGIAMQNRGHTFSLDPNHANALEPGKQTYHTIIPGFLSKDGQAVGPFGVMGGYMQPQGHVQVMMNMIDFALNPQAALDAPRWQWMKDKVVQVEPTFPDHIAQALQRKGHVIERSLYPNPFGRGQIIWRDLETGVLCGGTEPRTDGHIAVL